MKKKDQTPLTLKIVRWWYPRVERFVPTLAHRYFAKLFFTPLRFTAPEKEKKAETFAEKFSVEAEGKKVQCYTWGNGQPVLFIHGWGGRATQFRRFVKPLNAAGFQVVSFDGPAHGNSEGRRTSITEFEEAIRKICEIKGIPAAIVSHSFGGAVALSSVMNGLPVDKLVNIASPVIGDEILNNYLKATNASVSTKDFFKKHFEKTYGKSFDEYTSSYFIRHLPHPVRLLLVHDEDDREVSMRHPQELIKLYPSARLFRTKGLGHTRILKDDKVIDACVTFIQEPASRPWPGNH